MWSSMHKWDGLLACLPKLKSIYLQGKKYVLKCTLFTGEGRKLQLGKSFTKSSLFHLK